MLWDTKTDIAVRLLLCIIGFMVWASGCFGILVSFLFPILELHFRVALCIAGVGFATLGGILCIAIIMGFFDVRQEEPPSRSVMVRLQTPFFSPSPFAVAAARSATESPTYTMRPMRAYRPTELAPEIPPDEPLTLKEFEGSV